MIIVNENNSSYDNLLNILQEQSPQTITPKSAKERTVESAQQTLPEQGQSAHPVTITVTVNERPVVFHQRKADGAEIKASAIQQGVPIQQDFALFEVKGAGQLKPVGDSDEVTLHEHQKFRAVAPDDNS
jgi:hypothetical protein